MIFLNIHLLLTCARLICATCVVAAVECQLDDKTTKQGDDAIDSRGKKRTSSDVDRHPSKCVRCNVYESDDDAADAGDDRTACGNRSDRGDVENSDEVCSGGDLVQTEAIGNLQSDVNSCAPAHQTPEVDSLPGDPLPAKVLCCTDSSTTEVLAMVENSDIVTDDVTMTSSAVLPLPVISSIPFSEGLRSADSSCVDVASTKNTFGDDKTTVDVTVTSLKLLPAASLGSAAGISVQSSSTETICRGAGGPLPHTPTPTGIGRILHSAAGLFPFPVPMTICQRAPLVVDGSTMNLPRSGRWMPPTAHAATGQQRPPLRLVSPTAVPAADYFRKQHVTGCCGLGSPPQMRYYVVRPGDCGRPSDFPVCAALQPNSAVDVPDASQPLVLPHRWPVDPPRYMSTRQSSEQVSSDQNSIASADDDVIAKLDPVSRAVYDNFLGKLRATTKSKTGNGRRRGHVTDVTRRHRN